MTWPGPREAYAADRTELDRAIARTLESGMYILGPEVESFEAEFAAFVGTTSAVGVASGTDAIALALRAVGVMPGDLVATVSHTAVATVAAIEMTGAEPVLVDVDPATMVMDPTSLERTIAALGPVRAIVPVHLYGQPPDLAAITAIAKRFGATVVEDCSQAHGAAWAGRSVGTWGDAAAFSCYPTKNLAALGDAGVIAAAPAVADQARLLRQYGWRERYISDVPGVNSRLDPLQAAVLRHRLTTLPAANAARRAVAAWYVTHLPECVTPPPVAGDAHHVYHQYVVRLQDRERHLSALRAAEIPAAVLYPEPVHRQPAYAGRVSCDPAGLPATEQVCRELLCLPMHPMLTEEQVVVVCDALRRSLGESRT